jgi:hypothetical protein
MVVAAISDGLGQMRSAAACGQLLLTQAQPRRRYSRVRCAARKIRATSPRTAKFAFCGTAPVRATMASGRQEAAQRISCHADRLADPGGL